MPHFIGTATLLCLTLFASTCHGQHGHAAAHSHGHHERALEVEVVTVTDIVYYTVIVIASVASISSTSTVVLEGSTAPPITDSKQSIAASSDAPTVASPDTGSTSFHELKPIQASASIRNSCSYPVYVWSVGHESCGTGNECQFIAPNSTYTEGLRKCRDGGISLKVSRTKTAEKLMQFEYSVWASDNKTVSYDISYLDCMDHTNGQKDLSKCAGHDGGIQVVAGDASCPGYHCAAGEWCDMQAYVVAEFDYKPGAPVGACAVEKGIAFELCAGT